MLPFWDTSWCTNLRALKYFQVTLMSNRALERQDKNFHEYKFCCFIQLLYHIKQFIFSWCFESVRSFSKKCFSLKEVLEARNAAWKNELSKNTFLLKLTSLSQISCDIKGYQLWSEIKKMGLNLTDRAIVYRTPDDRWHIPIWFLSMSLATLTSDYNSRAVSQLLTFWDIV